MSEQSIVKSSETSRYRAQLNDQMTMYEVLDKKENRIICHCTNVADANRIAKAMNIDDSWEPLVSRSDMP